ncbi:MAG TPA: hypothetical protein VIW29_17825 [Polyangiaceae bacterium]
MASTPEFPRTWSFEPAGRLVHLRWAVGELALGIETPSAALDAAERALGIFGQRATALLESLEDEGEQLDDACFAARVGIGEALASLGQARPLRVERVSSLHDARRKLHRALVIVAEALAREAGARNSAVSGFDSPELGSLLALRQMFSAFRGSLISAGEERSRLSWALEVAAAELSILRANPAVSDLPVRSQQLIHELSKRVSDWGLKQADPVLGRALYREAFTVPEIALELSAHPLLIEHDERALSELSALLANEPASKLLDGQLLAQLNALRGLDAELDRQELNLLYGAAGVLGTLSLRVADLRARLSRPLRSAASWS